MTRAERTLLVAIAEQLHCGDKQLELSQAIEMVKAEDERRPYIERMAQLPWPRQA